MNKYNLIILCGKAGAGKDTLLQEVYKNNRTKCHLIISDTTRPPRSSNEQNGKSYNFLSEKDFFKKDHLEITSFNNWYYGTPIESLQKDKINIGVLNPSGIIQLSNNPDLKLTVFYIIADDKLRLHRQLNREEVPNITEINRRFLADKKDFDKLDTKFNFETLINNTHMDKEICLSRITSAIERINT